MLFIQSDIARFDGLRCTTTNSPIRAYQQSTTIELANHYTTDMICSHLWQQF